MQQRRYCSCGTFAQSRLLRYIRTVRKLPVDVQPAELSSPSSIATASSQASEADSVLARLRRGGRRITTSRRLLIRSLLEGPEHPTAETLTSAIQAGAPDVHPSTIYRNLEELEELGVVTHAHLGHGPAIYHMTPVDHGHLVCESCGSLAEVPASLFAELSEAAMSQYGFSVDASHYAVLGRCARCTRLPTTTDDDESRPDEV